MSAPQPLPATLPVAAPARGSPRQSVLGLLVLALAVVGASVTVVSVRHQTRMLNNRLENLRREADQLDVQWSQLQLEEATLTNFARIERQARRDGMLEPISPRMVPDGDAAPRGAAGGRP